MAQQRAQLHFPPKAISSKKRWWGFDKSCLPGEQNYPPETRTSNPIKAFATERPFRLYTQKSRASLANTPWTHTPWTLGSPLKKSRARSTIHQRQPEGDQQASAHQPYRCRSHDLAHILHSRSICTQTHFYPPPRRYFKSIPLRYFKIMPSHPIPPHPIPSLHEPSQNTNRQLNLKAAL